MEPTDPAAKMAADPDAFAELKAAEIGSTAYSFGYVRTLIEAETVVQTSFYRGQKSFIRTLLKQVAACECSGECKCIRRG